MLRGLRVSLIVAGGAGLSCRRGFLRRRVVHRASLLRPVAQLGAPDALDEAGLRRATPAPRVRSAGPRVAIISSAALSEPSAPPRQRWTSNAATEKDAFSDLLGGELGGK